MTRGFDLDEFMAQITERLGLDDPAHEPAQEPEQDTDDDPGDPDDGAA